MSCFGLFLYDFYLFLCPLVILGGTCLPSIIWLERGSPSPADVKRIFTCCSPLKCCHYETQNAPLLFRHGLKLGLDCPLWVGRMKWATGGTQGADGGQDIETLSAADTECGHRSTFPHRVTEREKWLFHKPQSLQGGGEGTMAPVQEGRRVSCSLFFFFLVCAASEASSGFSWYRYVGIVLCRQASMEEQPTVFPNRILTWSQGHRLSRKGQTITKHHSLLHNEPMTEKHQRAMIADTILWHKRLPSNKTKKMKLKEINLSCFKLRSSYTETDGHFD